MDLNSRFNRIIDLYFYTNAESKIPAKIIKCPRHGRKPTIEINGTYTSRGYLSAFNITVKNLYFNLETERYAKVKVEAGYAAGKPCSFEGTILSIYPEQPGPEGSTVIQCQQGKIDKWLETTVQLDYPARTSLIEVLEAIKQKLGAALVKPGETARSLNLPDPGFTHDGTARGALAKLEEIFADKKLVLFMRENFLYAECLETDTTGEKILQYISAPPQPNPGGERGTFYSTVTAPWMPDLNLFDRLIIPSRVYIRNYGLVGTGKSKTQEIQVTDLSFHFGTTGNVNSMTVRGPIAR